MTQCLLNTGYSLGCINNTGGIQEVYIKTFSGATYILDEDNIITGMTVELSASTWYTYEQRNENAEFLEEGNHSTENGTNFWVQTVNLIFHKREAALRNTIYLLARNDLIVIVKTQNGDYWLIGKQNGCNLEGSSGNVGKSYGDLNGYTISIIGKEPQPAHEVSSTLIGNLTLSN